MIKTKRVSQLDPAKPLSAADLFIVEQDNNGKVGTRKASFELLGRSLSHVLGASRDLEMRVDSDYLQYRYVGDSTWTNLIAVSELGGGTASPGVPSFFTGTGSQKTFSPVPGLSSTDASKCIVTVGGVTQQHTVSYTVSLANGGSLIFDEAPPIDLPISIQPLQ